MKRITCVFFDIIDDASFSPHTCQKGIRKVLDATENLQKSKMFEVSMLLGAKKNIYVKCKGII